jgi:hypothetical protein
MNGVIQYSRIVLAPLLNLFLRGCPERLEELLKDIQAILHEPLIEHHGTAQIAPFVSVDLQSHRLISPNSLLQAIDGITMLDVVPRNS